MIETPCDPAAERAVIASVFTYGADAYLDVADIVSTKTFSIDSNQVIWNCIQNAFKDNPNGKIDLPTLLSSAKTLGVNHLLDKPDERQHLRAVMNLPVVQENARRMAGKIRKLEIARDGLGELELAGQRLRAVTGDESIDQIIAMTEQPGTELSARLTNASNEGPQDIGNGIEEYIAYLAANQRQTVGICTGYRWYDTAIGGGLRPGTINVIGARPKTGKTLYGMNVGVHVAAGAGYDWPKFDAEVACPVLYLDTEMTKEDQRNRMLAMVSGVSIDDIEKGIYANDPVKKQRVEDAARLIKVMPYQFLSIAGQPLEETLAVMRRWVTKSVGLDENGHAKPCLIIFDYLKLMTADSMESSKLAEFQVLGFMMTALHNFAVRYKVPILLFIQLNRDGIDSEDTGTASGSDRIVWLCSNFTIYKCQSDEEIGMQAGNKQVYNRKLVPVVARHGAGLKPGDYINVMSHGAIAKIVEGPTRNELGEGPDRGQPQGIVVENADKTHEPIDL